MKINTHGLPMHGLKKVSGETSGDNCYSDRYSEIFYDRQTGEVWTVFQVSVGQNSYTVYDDENVLKICNAPCHMTMQELADAIYRKVTERAALDRLP